jgi:ATP-dependent helicase IRC3
MPMITLRPYQQEIVDAVLLAELDGIQSQVISLATGGGKTAIATYLCFRHSKPHAPHRILWLCDQEELALQALDAFTAYYPPTCLGLIQAENNDLDRQVTVAVIDSLRQPQRLARFLHFGKPAIVIVDEAHGSITQEYDHVLDHVIDGDRTLVLGLTATPFRSDRQSLAKRYTLVATKGMLDLMAEKDPATGQPYLADLTCYSVTTDVDLSGIAVQEGQEYPEEQLQIAVSKSKNRHVLAVAAWRQWANNLPTILFAAGRADAERFVAAFQAEGIATFAVFGDTDKQERRRLLGNRALHQPGEFEQGKYAVFVNVGVAGKGLDFPFVRCILMARHCHFSGTWIQMVGRGVRRAPGKDTCVLIDLADNHHSCFSVDRLIGTTTAQVPSVRRVLAETRECQERDPDPFWEQAEEAIRTYHLHGVRKDVFSAPTAVGRWVHHADENRFTLESEFGSYELRILGGTQAVEAIRHTAQRSFPLHRDPVEFRIARGLVEQDITRRRQTREHQAAQLQSTDPVSPQTLAKCRTCKLYMVQPTWTEGRAQGVLARFYKNPRTFHREWYSRSPKPKNESARTQQSPAKRRVIT